MLRRFPLISTRGDTTGQKRTFLQSKGKATVGAHSCGWPGDGKTNQRAGLMPPDRPFKEGHFFLQGGGPL